MEERPAPPRALGEKPAEALQGALAVIGADRHLGGELREQAPQLEVDVLALALDPIHLLDECGDATCDIDLH